MPHFAPHLPHRTMVSGPLLSLAPRAVHLLRTMARAGAEDVICRTVGNKGVLVLNRPQALNAFNFAMALRIYEQLRVWERTKELVIVKGAGGRAFCAGGDVKSEVFGGDKDVQAFFKLCYRTNGLIGGYRAPYVAFIDGIVMGGGAGLSVHGRYRVATERSLFAMPEARIGFFPDVGSSHFLSRMPGKLGLYLALTGHRLKGVDLLRAGVATHYTDSKNLEALELALLNTSDQEGIDDVLRQFSKTVEGEFSLAPVLEHIDSCFNGGSVEEIVQRLENDGSDWAMETLNLLGKMSPTSLKITQKQLELGANLRLKECLEMEYRMVITCLGHRDFYEGVRALLIDKDQSPKWNPAKLEDVSPALVDSHFAKLPDSEELWHH